MAEQPWLTPQASGAPFPDGVQALTTLRWGGYSAAPYASLNLGDRTGDDPAAVAANRRLLAERAGLPEGPRWLAQVHGTEVVPVHRSPPEPEADAAWTDRPGVVCAVLTADCLPVVLAARDASVVAVAHAGWRGLAGGVLEALVAAVPVPAAALVAWLGPAIGGRAFEVGPEVAEALGGAGGGARAGLVPGAGDRWHADLARLAAQRLRTLGLPAVVGGERCTYSEPAAFFSHRRDGPTGRMATVVHRA